jgi:hypothetical protein
LSCCIHMCNDIIRGNDIISHHRGSWVMESWWRTILPPHACEHSSQCYQLWQDIHTKFNGNTSSHSSVTVKQTVARKTANRWQHNLGPKSQKTED